jgi:hypothetical protein
MDYNLRVILAWLFVFAGLALGATVMFCGATAGVLQGETCELVLDLLRRILPL